MTDTVTTPDPYLSITYKTEQKRLFMSYRRLNSALRALGDPSNMISMMTDPDISENMLRVAVAERGDPAAFFDVELGDGDFNTEDADRILIWVRDHITGFFAKRLQQSETYVKSLEPMMIALRSSLSGLAPSSSSEPVAGPSE